MSSNEKTNETNKKTNENANVESLDAVEALAGAGAANDDSAALGAGNDNATPGGGIDTTPFVAGRYVVRYIQGTLRRYGVRWQDMADAIADVQADAIDAARTRRMPASREEWRALAVTIAVRWAIDRLRGAEVHAKYDAGHCDDADAYAQTTLHWEQRDPVDTKRYLAILKGLFDSGQMPEDGAEILWAEAEGVPHAEIAAELGVTETIVDNRLSRMRKTFRARLAALGMLPLLLLLVGALLAPAGGPVAAPAPEPEPVAPTPAVDCEPSEDAGFGDGEEKSTPTVRGICPLPD
jgi:DNA-directed RNA polymerase specialized sigma24 family protein